MTLDHTQRWLLTVCFLGLAVAGVAGDAPQAIKPPGPSRATTDNRDFQVSASIKSVRPGAAKQGRTMVLFDVKFTSATVPPVRFALGQPVAIKSVTTDAGETLPGEYDNADGHGSFPGGYRLTMSAAVPEETQWLREVTAEMIVLRPGRTETLTWAGPAASLGQERKAGDSVFTLMTYQGTPDGADVVVLGKVPKDLGPLSLFWESALRCSNGKDGLLGASGCNGGGGEYRWNRSFKLPKGSVPTAFALTVPVEAKREIVNIRFENLVLTESPAGAAPARPTDGGTTSAGKRPAK